MADRNLKSRLHIGSTIIVIMIGMMVLDAYLVQQNTGNRRTGVLVMLLIGDVCLLFVLRYVGVWVGTEVRMMKRGCSIAEWFLLIFVLDIKMYFVLEDARKECFTKVEEAIGQTTEVITDNSKESASIFQPQLTFTGKENLSTEELMLAYAQIGVRSPYEYILTQCDYAIVTKKMLTLFHAVYIPGFYLLLLGADYIEGITSLRELDEIKMRAFWVVVDILDLLDLQSSMWESRQGDLPYFTVGFIYFYCYIILVVLPPLSLAEMSKRNESRPHETIIYLLASFFTINAAATAIRLVLLFNNRFLGVSSIFIGKNIVCIFLKVTKLVQIYLVKERKIRFQRDDPKPFTLNDLRKHDRNRIDPGSDIVESKNNENCHPNEASLAHDESAGAERIKADTEHVEYEQNHVWNNPSFKEQNISQFSSNNMNTANVLVTKLGNYSSPITEFATQQQDTPSSFTDRIDTSTWALTLLDSERKAGGDYRSMDELLNNNLSPENSQIFSRKMSRSISAAIDLCSESSTEKKVRFQNKKLSPVNSEDFNVTLERTGKVNDSNARLPLSFTSSDSNHILSSTENSTSTTECGLQLESIKKWNKNVIDHIEALQSNLRNGFEDAIESINGEDNSPHSNYQEENDKFLSKLPPPLVDSSVESPQRFVSSRSAFEPIKTESSLPFSATASFMTSSTSMEFKTSLSATASGVLPPPIELSEPDFGRPISRYLDSSDLENSFARYANSVQNGLETTSSPIQEENCFRQSEMQERLLLENEGFPDQTVFAMQNLSASGLRKMVSTASQTNMAQAAIVQPCSNG